MATTVEVREGFLCPMCMKDLGTVTQLQSHFEEAHSAEDKDVLQSLRGLFGKAKKKILGDKDENGSFDSSDSTDVASKYKTPAPSVAGYDPSLWEPQEIGVTRSKTDMFRAIRGERVDRCVVETNKLIIRLDKLVGEDAPTDSGKRKKFEMSVVPWTPDNQVPSCPGCGKSFSFTKRRHHCRLCGGIMCDKCSQFLPYSFGKKLTDPAYEFESAGSGFLRRAGSNSSLNSMMSPEGEPHIRTCENCRILLEKRNQQVQQRYIRPDIVLLYEKLKSCIDNTEELMKNFMPMVESLSNGESTHSLREAQMYRVKIMKLYDVIDGLSKKILVLGSNSDPPLTPKQAQLQKAIRAYASNFMQENVIGLQSLPSEEQYQKLQEARKLEIQRRIAKERQATMEAQERERRKHEQKENMHKGAESVPRQTEERKRSGSQKLSGWIPQESSVNFSDRDDPMVQQMNIIRGYIKQARQAQKFDEVNMLEQNLKELQQEYIRQQKQNWS